MKIIKALVNFLFTINIFEIRDLLGIAFFLFIVSASLFFFFVNFNILYIEPLMCDLASMGDTSSISELLELMRERYKIPGDLQMIGSLYFDRHPAYYFQESEEKNLFRLLNISLHWDIKDNRDYYLRELEKIADRTDDLLLKYRIFLHIAIYYSYLADQAPEENLNLFRHYLNKANRIPVPEMQRVDIYYYYAYYHYLNRNYREALNYLNRTIFDDKFIDARLLQLMVFICIEQNYYFYRMEAFKLTNSIIKSPETDNALIMIIVRLLLKEGARDPANPFFNYFLSIFYEEVNDLQKAVENARAFEDRYKKPVYDYFIEDNRRRLRNLERKTANSHDRY